MKVRDTMRTNARKFFIVRFRILEKLYWQGKFDHQEFIKRVNSGLEEMDSRMSRKGKPNIREKKARILCLLTKVMLPRLKNPFGKRTKMEFFIIFFMCRLQKLFLDMYIWEGR